MNDFDHLTDAERSVLIEALQFQHAADLGSRKAIAASLLTRLGAAPGERRDWPMRSESLAA